MLPTPLGTPLPEAVGASRYPRGIPNWKTIAVGDAVRIHSIHSRPMLNEKKGTVVQAADPVTGRVGVLVEGEEQPLSLKRTNLALPGDTPVREERVSVRLPPDEDSIMGAPLSRSEQALQHFRANHTPSIKLVFEDGKWSAKASRGIPAGEVLYLQKLCEHSHAADESESVRVELAAKGSVPPALQNCVFTHTAQGVALVMKRALYEINVSEPRWADLLAHERPLRLALNVGEIAGVCSRDQIEEMLAPKFEAAGFAKRYRAGWVS